jgi:hypothetical protein
MSPLGLKSGKKKDAEPVADAKPSKADKKAAKAAAAAEKAAAKAAAKAGKATAAASGRGVVVEKPPANIYTALLALSLVAILVAIACLYAEMNAYEWKMK